MGYKRKKKKNSKDYKEKQYFSGFRPRYLEK